MGSQCPQWLPGASAPVWASANHPFISCLQTLTSMRPVPPARTLMAKSPKGSSLEEVLGVKNSD